MGASARTRSSWRTRCRGCCAGRDAVRNRRFCASEERRQLSSICGDRLLVTARAHCDQRLRPWGGASTWSTLQSISTTSTSFADFAVGVGITPFGGGQVLDRRVGTQVAMRASPPVLGRWVGTQIACPASPPARLRVGRALGAPGAQPMIYDCYSRPGGVRLLTRPFIIYEYIYKLIKQFEVSRRAFA